MGIFLQLRVAMRRQHFPMSVDVNPFSICLFQQFFQVIQVMTGNDNKRTLFYFHAHLSRYRIPKAGGIGFVQQPHTLEINLPEFHQQR